MPVIPQDQLETWVTRVENAPTVQEKGRALEDLICSLFLLIPGVDIAERNALNAFGAEEIDIAFYNAKDQDGLPFMPFIFLAECKNWEAKVRSPEVVAFIGKCRNRGCDHGILVAANGITGVPAELQAAHYELARALGDGLRLIVITMDDIRRLATTEELVVLMKRKLCQLVVAGTMTE